MARPTSSLKLHPIGPGIEATISAKFDPGIREYTKRYEARLIKGLALMKKHFKLPSDLRVILRPIATRGCRGNYQVIGHTVTLDPRRTSFFALLSTLAHELVHAEQFHQGRMSYVLSCRAAVFEGTTYSLAANGNFGDKYLNLPWEKEARARQDAVASAVLLEMGIFFNHIEDGLPQGHLIKDLPIRFKKFPEKNG